MKEAEQVNILKCCGGHEDHLDSCPVVFGPNDDLLLDEDDQPWAPGLL